MAKPYICPSCRVQWTAERITAYRRKYPEVPSQFCPQLLCGPRYLQNVRRRQRRKPTLPEHVINLLGSAGYGNASRGTRHLIDAHMQDITTDPPRHPPLDLGLVALNKWLVHMPAPLCWPRVVALTLDADRYEALRVIYEANLSTLSPEQRRRPGRGGYKTQGKTVAMAPVLCALARRFEQDPQYREAVLALTPAVDRALYDAQSPNQTPTASIQEEDWLA